MSSVGSSRRGMRSVVTLPFAPRDAAPLRPGMRRHCAQCSLSDSVVNASNASFVGEPECIQDDVARFSR